MKNISIKKCFIKNDAIVSVTITNQNNEFLAKAYCNIPELVFVEEYEMFGRDWSSVRVFTSDKASSEDYMTALTTVALQLCTFNCVGITIFHNSKNDKLWPKIKELFEKEHVSNDFVECCLDAETAIKARVALNNYADKYTVTYC